MIAFVTGATGFIGTHLIKELDKAGWNIIALHRPTSDISELKKCKNLTLAAGDITDIASLRRGIPESVNAVFHVAGSVGHLPHYLENSRYTVNQSGTKNVVDVCKERKIGRLIYTSTVLTYDFRACRPLTEEAPPNEWSRDQYIHSKRLADIEVDKGLEVGLDIVSLHPSAIFGSYDKATWSKMFLEIQRGLPLPFAPPGGGSICHARKVAEAHIAAFHRGGRGRHYILGGPDVTWLHVMQEIARILRKPGPVMALSTPIFKAYGFMEYWLSTKLKRTPMLTPHTIYILSEKIYSDSTRAERELGYKSSSLQEMLLDCHEWMVATGMLPPLSGN